METIMDSDCKKIGGLYHYEPTNTHRKALIDEEVTFSDFSERVHHQKNNDQDQARVP